MFSIWNILNEKWDNCIRWDVEMGRFYHRIIFFGVAAGKCHGQPQVGSLVLISKD